ncbi:MAG: hypothetical protein NC417_04790 [Candidatus Gastranaerophilales bacterium]|nr:hypothetical protein [Candidatus Gastranaerophilales bacterium]
MDNIQDILDKDYELADKRRIDLNKQGITFIFAGYSDMLMQSMFKDFQNCTDVKIVKKLFPFNEYVNGLFRGLAMRFFRYRICQYVLYILQKTFCPLEKATVGDGEQYLIFTNAASIGVSVLYLKDYLDNHKKCTPVMLFVDPLDRYWAQYAKFLVESIPSFRCYTFDPSDACNTGFQYTMNVYSYLEPAPGGTKTDIYFSFFGLDRLDIVRELADYLKERQVDCNFIYVGSIDEKKNQLGNVKHVEKHLEYAEILKDAAGANCLLEVLRPGQTGSTLRYYEAICYNKKLLTTNRNVVNLPFYDPRYIRIFETLSDIDHEWIRRREPVDYHYDGRFSPVHFLEELSKA